MVYALSDCKMLNDLDSRAMLFGAAYAKAMVEHRPGSELAGIGLRSPKMDSGSRVTAYGAISLPPSRLRAPVSP